MEEATTAHAFSHPVWGEAGEALALPASASMGRQRLALQSGLPLIFDGVMPRALPHSDTVRRRLALKRGADIVAGTMALLVLWPLLAGLAASIALTTPGPVLLRQLRVGQGGRRIRVWKFRTMHADRCDDAGLCQVAPGDPRITPVGRFLRRHSLDELPQLINVLRGDMALVGPRPHTPGMRAAGMPYAQLVPYYALRQSVKPGLTGWAQVNGLRGPTLEAGRARARIDHDLAYIQNLSLGLDLRIILTTLRREICGGTGS